MQCNLGEIRNEKKCTPEDKIIQKDSSPSFVDFSPQPACTRTPKIQILMGNGKRYDAQAALQKQAAEDAFRKKPPVKVRLAFQMVKSTSFHGD